MGATSLFLLLSLPLLTSATTPQPVFRAQLSPFHPLNPLQPRRPSPQDFCDGINCGNLCVPNGYHCCSDGGAGCPIGSTCIPNGCCPNGETCDGGGGTLTLPGGSGPAPTTFDSGPEPSDEPSDTFSSDSFSLLEPSTTPAATGKKATAGGGAAATTQDAYESYLATATGDGFGGGAAISSLSSELSAISIPSFSSPTFDLSAVPSPTSSLRSGGDSGGSSSGGSSQQVAAGAGRLSYGTLMSACGVVVSLVAVLMF